MSIDARIIGVSRKADQSVTVALEDRKSHATAGQNVLTILNPPENVIDLHWLIGLEIWGGSSQILIGDRKLADRDSYTTITLVQSWRDLAREQQQ